MIEIRTPGEDDFGPLTEFDARSFGSGAYTPEDREMTRPTMDLERYRLAFDNGAIVGAAGSDPFEMTLPGLTTIPMAGVTWVAVAVTHRRQGLLRRLMGDVHEDIADRGEPVACLTASEGGIYERFGYGVATRRRIIEIDRRRSSIAERFRPPAGSVQVSGGAADGVEEERWDRYRRGRAGELSRSPEWQAKMRFLHGADAVTAVHDDGFATWKATPAWNEGHPAHTVRVLDFAAATSAAHAALWHTLLSVDLVGAVTSNLHPIDDPLPYLLDDARMMRTTGVNDGVWCKPMDIAACFGGRRYGTDDSIVLEVDGARWQVDGTADDARCRKVRRRADVVTDQAGAGALMLGGVTPSQLVAGRRAEVRDHGASRRADAFFATSPLPHSTTAF
ncbi:MAG: GNAT family N-acetyltransferase [Ilumatobacteraceae bacterium]